MRPEHLARCLYGRLPDDHAGRSIALAVLSGDPEAGRILYDVLEEESLVEQPFVVGEAYLICTVTLYYVGRVKRAGYAWVELEDASWVHWTGRLSELLKKADFAKLASRKPRTEYCGLAGISTASIVSYYPWPGKLPRESIQ